MCLILAATLAAGGPTKSQNDDEARRHLVAGQALEKAGLIEDARADYIEAARADNGQLKTEIQAALDRINNAANANARQSGSSYLQLGFKLQSLGDYDGAHSAFAEAFKSGDDATISWGSTPPGATGQPKKLFYSFSSSVAS